MWLTARGSVGRGSRETELFLPDGNYHKMDNNIAKAIAARNAEIIRIRGLSMSQQRKAVTVVGGVDIRTGQVIPVCIRYQAKYPLNQFIGASCIIQV